MSLVVCVCVCVCVCICVVLLFVIVKAITLGIIISSAFLRKNREDSCNIKLFRFLTGTGSTLNFGIGKCNPEQLKLQFPQGVREYPASS